MNINFKTHRTIYIIGLLMTVLMLNSGCNYTNNVSYTPVPKGTAVIEKKQHFFKFFSPIIQRVNLEIETQRNTVLTLKDKINSLSSKDKQKLKQLAKQYKETGQQDLSRLISLLLIKINTIPESLALAQAANESAWGSSRFAQKGNNFFGQWCFTKGCGLVPNSRLPGSQHEVEVFKSPYQSVKSYINNLNSHPSYQKLRELRMNSLQKKIQPTGYLLANGLTQYSARGLEYIKELQSMITYNHLE